MDYLGTVSVQSTYACFLGFLDFSSLMAAKLLHMNHQTMTPQFSPPCPMRRLLVSPLKATRLAFSSPDSDITLLVVPVTW